MQLTWMTAVKIVFSSSFTAAAHLLIGRVAGRVVGCGRIQAQLLSTLTSRAVTPQRTGYKQREKTPVTTASCLYQEHVYQKHVYSEHAPFVEQTVMTNSVKMAVKSMVAV